MPNEILDPLVTECPKCNTRFRVTETQLQVAAGRVRCGACLLVFDGTEHLRINGELYRPDDPDADLDSLLEELAAGESGDASFPTDELSSYESANNEMPAEASGTEQASMDCAASDAASETAIDDGGNGFHPGTRSADGLADLEAELMAELRSGSPLGPVAPRTPGEASEAPGEHSASDESDRPEVGAAVTGAEDGETVDDSWQHDPVLADADTAATVADSHAAQAAVARPALEGLPDFDPLFEASGNHDEGEESSSSWATWAVASLAVVAITLQILWLQYDRWVLDDRFRPLYQSLCTVAGCELPARRDLSKIATREALLRPHPGDGTALVYDAVVINRAEFPQPFPVVEIVFTSIQGQVVAWGRFQPEEYLAGEVAPHELMKPRTPVHIALEMEAPEQRGLNYQVTYR
jgi:predicted Zn finger-like uncharacterized protein